MGTSDKYLRMLDIVVKKYGKGRSEKQRARDEEMEISEGESDAETDGFDANEAWGQSERPWERGWPSEETSEVQEGRRRGRCYELEERHDAVVRTCARREQTAEDRKAETAMAKLTVSNTAANEQSASYGVH